MKRNLVVALTGASGVVYGVRLVEVLLSTGCDVQLTISPAAVAVLKQELDLTVDLDHFDPASLKIDPASTREDERLKRLRAMWGIASEQSSVLSVASGEPGRVYYRDCRDRMAPLASGTYQTDGMIVCPCSGSTLGAIAGGVNSNLIHRAAEVHLKEGRPLVLVPRETPLNGTHLENMFRAARAGATILPASPGFYHAPKSIRDLVDFVVSKICDRLGVKNNLIERWGNGT
ncbi:MAG: UbiX family flavin prenyltransferase [Pirellulales bacterium]|nr:UbiX family flavin prenyltransferase [Pirellulales bacterium]